MKAHTGGYPCLSNCSESLDTAEELIQGPGLDCSFPQGDYCYKHRLIYRLGFENVSYPTQGPAAAGQDDVKVAVTLGLFSCTRYLFSGSYYNTLLCCLHVASSPLCALCASSVLGSTVCELLQWRRSRKGSLSSSSSQIILAPELRRS